MIYLHFLYLALIMTDRILILKLDYGKRIIGNMRPIMGKKCM